MEVRGLLAGLAVAALMTAGCAPRFPRGSEETPLVSWKEELELGDRAFRQQDLALAETHWLAAADSAQRPASEDHTIATRFNQLGLTLAVRDDHEKAESYFKRSLELDEKAEGKDHPDVATGLDNLANLYHTMGRHAEAEPLFLRALKIREEKLGKEHHHVAVSLSNLANHYMALKQYPEAEALFKQALAIDEKAKGAASDDVADTLEDYAYLLKQMGRAEEAEKTLARSRLIRASQKPDLIEKTP